MKTFMYDGYHGLHTISVKPLAVRIDRGFTVFMVSSAVAKRISKLVCGISDCRCGEGIADDGHSSPEIWVQPNGVVRGNYPQGG